MAYEVSITRCASYGDAVVHDAVVAALAPWGGLASFVHAGDRVLLKLNLLSAQAPERAVTTHPALVRVMVRMVQALGATPMIGDSPGGINTGTSYQTVLRKTGLQQVIEETGCAWCNFDDAVTEVICEHARVYKKLPIVTAPLDADVVIALPKLKTHQFTYFTGAVKLLYGYLPGLTKAEYHLHAGRDVARFAELLLDIAESFPPALTIMDAVTAMEGRGPANGTPRHLGVLLAGPSLTAMDYIAARLIGLNPLTAPTIREAIKRGVGPATLEEITLTGAPLDAVRVTDFQQADTVSAGSFPTWFADLSSWLFSTRPVIDARACLRCGKCADLCPPKAMTFTKGAAPVIDYAPCLRCYCCQEHCPADAVRIAGPRVRFPKKIGRWLTERWGKKKR